MATSSAVSSGELATAAQYNNLRTDVLTTHDHDGSDGSATISATTFDGAAAITAQQTVNDDVLKRYGTSGDVGVVLRSSTLSANTALTGIAEGTPASLATAANSLMIGNVTDDGDVHILVSKAGTSHTAFLADGSTGDTVLNAATGQSVDLYVAGTKEYDFSASAADLNGNHLDNAGYLVMNAVTLPAGTEVYAGHDNSGDLTANVLTGKDFNVAVNGVDQAIIDDRGVDVITGNEFLINGTSVLNATTLGSGVTASSLTSVGSLTSLTALGTVTVGADDAGHDVKFFGATSGAYFLYDESADRLILDQSTVDSYILELRSSTDITQPNGSYDTAAYGVFAKDVADGGLTITGLKDTATDSKALVLFGILGATAADTGKTTGDFGIVHVNTRVSDGGGGGANPGANQNLMSIGGSTTQFIFDVEGSGHSNVEWVTYDKEDDIQLLGDIERALLEDGSPEAYDLASLSRLGIVGKGSFHYENGRPKAMINWQRMAMLHHGAIRKVYDEAMTRIDALTSQLEAHGVLPAA